MKQVKKFAVIGIVIAMLLTLVACGEETKETKKKTEPAETETSISENREPTLTTETSETEATQVTSEPNQTLPSDVNISETSETTEQPQPGKYTYTVYEGTQYEETFTLDVNIDEYFYVAEGNGERYFDLPRLCYDLGCFYIQGSDGNPLPIDGGDHSGQVISYYDENLDMNIQIRPEGKTSNKCYSQITVQFLSSSFDRYYDDSIFEQYEYYDANVDFKGNQERYARIDGLNHYSIGLSYDNIVVLVYTMNFLKDNPGKNPFYYTSWQNSCSGLDGEYYMGYDLPF